VVKVLILVEGLSVTGVEVFTRNLCLGLAGDAEIEVNIAIATLPPQRYEPELSAAGIPIHRTAELGGLRSYPRHLRAVYKLLRAARKTGRPFDAVHCEMEYYNGLLLFVSWLAGVPLRIAHSHTAKTAGQSKRFGVRLYRRCMQGLMRIFGTAFLACSPAAGAAMFPFALAKQITFLPNGIDMNRFYPKVTVPASGKAVNLLFVGRLSFEKNPLFLIDVLRQLHTIGMPAHLSFVGIGELTEELRAKAATYGLADSISLLGLRDDIPDLMRAADLLLMPSLYEGFGIVLLEAQACSLPCIASTGVPPTADCGGVTFLPLEASLWAAQIQTCAGNGFPSNMDRDKLAGFSLDAMVRTYRAFIRRQSLSGSSPTAQKHS
jgi:glycosyltransferase EpsF